MDVAFWLARWKDGQIGFHQGRPNEFLERHAASRLLPIAPRRRVLVPLCGKTEDLAFLARDGHEVVGVEVAGQAIVAFFAEHGLTPVTASRAYGHVYTAGPITIHQGDFFDVTQADIGPADAFFDRAALIALPPEIRRRYVDHLRSLLRPAATGLVVTLEYLPGAIAGPPFSLGADEVKGLFAGDLLEEIDCGPATSKTLAAAGASGTERCFAVTLSG